MGMGPAGVFVVESLGVDQMAYQCSETPIVAEMLKLLRMPYVARRVESRAHLVRDASIYRQREFDALLFSAHGAPGEIGLTTGETVPVGELFELYNGPSRTAVLFSSCDVLSGEAMVRALASKSAPDYVLGYDTSIYWDASALASVMLVFALAQNQFGRMLSTLLAIRECAGVDVCGYMRTQSSDVHQWFSTDGFIRHAQEASGAKNQLELSVLIAKYMQHEREQFTKRTDEYFQAAREMEASNRPASPGMANEASANIDRLHRPENTL